MDPEDITAIMRWSKDHSVFHLGKGLLTEDVFPQREKKAGREGNQEEAQLVPGWQLRDRLRRLLEHSEDRTQRKGNRSTTECDHGRQYRKRRPGS